MLEIGETQTPMIPEHLRLGVEYYQSGQLKEAETCFQQVLQWKPNCADAWNALGSIAAQQKQYSIAIERIEHAIALDPNEATFFSNLGNVYFEQQQFKQAIESYQKVLKLNPANAYAQSQLDTICKNSLNLDVHQKQLKQQTDIESTDKAKSVKDTRKLINQCIDYRTQHFEWHCQYIYENYLKNWQPRSLPKSSKYTAVIVENRCHPLLEFAIKNTLLFTSNEVGLQIFCTNSNLDFIKNIVKDIENVRITVLSNLTQIEPSTYSRLLKNPAFWESIPSEKILVFQYDTILTEPLDISWFEYPYLGAPWRKEDMVEEFFLYQSDGNQSSLLQKSSFEVRRQMNRKAQDPCRSGFGNGGLSIRDRQVMLDICNQYPDHSNYPEDLYFSYHVYNNAEIIPDINIARKFATETWFCADSVGIHASWKYLSSEKQAYFFEKHHKNILGHALINLQSSTITSVNNEMMETKVSPKISIVVVTYNQDFELQCLLNSLFSQTYKENFEIIILHDGPNQKLNKEISDLSTSKPKHINIRYYESIYRENCWGHNLRDWALKELVKGEWVLLTNGDNYYTPIFLSEMLKTVSNEVGVVYCDFVHSHLTTGNLNKDSYGYFKSDFKPCRCDIGAFITRTDLAKAVGFNSRINEADAVFIGQLLEYRLQHPFSIQSINKVLFVHN